MDTSVAVAPPAGVVPTITDGTLVLDGLRRDDAIALVAVHDERIEPALEPSPVEPPLSLEEATGLIDTWASEWADETGQRVFAVRRDGALIGVVKARISLGGWLATLDVRIAPSARGKGSGVRALRLVADYAIDLLGASRLRIDSQERNRPARALCESLGFKRLDKPAFGREGQVYYGITQEEWEERSRELARHLGEGSIA